MYSQSFQTVNLRALLNISLVFHTLLNHRLMYLFIYCAPAAHEGLQPRSVLGCVGLMHTHGEGAALVAVLNHRTDSPSQTVDTTGQQFKIKSSTFLSRLKRACVAPHACVWGFGVVLVFCFVLFLNQRHWISFLVLQN